MPTRSIWGWGYEEQAYTQPEIDKLQQLIGGHFGSTSAEIQPLPRRESLSLRNSRLTAPASLSGMLSDELSDRAGHTYGKAFRDVVRGLAGDFRNAPDLIARPWRIS